MTLMQDHLTDDQVEVFVYYFGKLSLEEAKQIREHIDDCDLDCEERVESAIENREMGIGPSFEVLERYQDKK